MATDLDALSQSVQVTERPPASAPGDLLGLRPVTRSPVVYGLSPAPDIQGQVVVALREMLDWAEREGLPLTPVLGVGLAVVLEHENVRCTIIVNGPDGCQGLSPREMQIARLVASGATNRAIASALEISLWTVSTHLRRVFAKLNVSSRAEMVAQLFGTPHITADQ